MGTRLAGKVAIVTGGASGIGAAACRLFASEGAVAVVIADIQDDRGRALAADIEVSGGRALYRHLDVTREDEWRETIGEVVRQCGRLDVLVNSAGLPSRADVENTLEEAWDRTFAVNAKGMFLGLKHAIPAMRRGGGGSIVNVVSIYGLVGSPVSAAYHSSKGAARVLTKAAAIRHAPEKIRVNAVHPGFVDTPMTAAYHAQPEVRAERVALTPLGRLAGPEDIAPGILYLASDESSFVTGADLVIDGGMTAR